MTIQGVLVLVLATLAAVYLAWHVIGPVFGGAAKSSGCHGCSAACDTRATAKTTSPNAVKPVMWVTKEAALNRPLAPPPKAGRTAARRP